MDSVNEPGIHTLVVMSCAQVGKTETINNIFGYFIHFDPSPMLIVQPTIEMGKTWSKDRLTPMVRDTKELQDCFSANRSRDSSNTILHKNFAGGHVTVAGANSPASLASRPVRIIGLDEIDRYPVSAGKEGDPVELARRRSSTFWNRFVIETSTPTVKGASRIDESFEQSDQRHFFVECPACKDRNTLHWEHIQFDKESPHTSTGWCCPGCGTFHPEKDQLRIIATVEPRALSTSHGIAGFHLNELYSTWRTWSEVVIDFLKARQAQKQGDLTLMQVWVNTSLGESYEPLAHKVSHSKLYKRREDYSAEVPQPVNLLTIGADVQIDRVEFEVTGWAAGEECFAIDYQILRGDLHQPAYWQKLAGLLRQTYRRADGLVLAPRLVCIDSGGAFTDEVYQFCRRFSKGDFIPIKGASQAGKPIITIPAKPNRAGVRLAMIGTDTAKEQTYGRYEVADPGPGYCHWPKKDCFDSSYFRQLTAERKKKKYVLGRPRFEWTLAKGTSNEASDCRVYSFAAMRALKLYWKIDIAISPLPPKEQKTEKNEGTKKPGFTGGRRSGWFER